MEPTTDTRIKPAIRTALLADHVKTAQVATHMGIIPWTLKYSWLASDEKQKLTPALIHAVALYMGMKDNEVTEEYHPINQTSSVL